MILLAFVARKYMQDRNTVLSCLWYGGLIDCKLSILLPTFHRKIKHPLPRLMNLFSHHNDVRYG